MIYRILIQTTGNYTCNVLLGDEEEVARIKILVYRYTVESSSMGILNGTNVSVTCTLFPGHELAKNHLRFCVDGKRLVGTYFFLFRANEQ